MVREADFIRAPLKLDVKELRGNRTYLKAALNDVFCGCCINKDLEDSLLVKMPNKTAIDEINEWD